MFFYRSVCEDNLYCVVQNERNLVCAVDKKENLSKKKKGKKIEYSLNTSEDIYLVKRLFKDKRSKE